MGTVSLRSGDACAYTTFSVITPHPDRYQYTRGSRDIDSPAKPSPSLNLLRPFLATSPL